MAVVDRVRGDDTIQLADAAAYEQHAALCESLKNRGILPVTFALMPAHSWHPDVWSDVARMRTLNAAQVHYVGQSLGALQGPLLASVAGVGSARGDSEHRAAPCRQGPGSGMQFPRAGVRCPAPRRSHSATRQLLPSLPALCKSFRFWGWP